jgi:hypothetical protein
MRLAPGLTAQIVLSYIPVCACVCVCRIAVTVSAFRFPFSARFYHSNLSIGWFYLLRLFNILWDVHAFASFLQVSITTFSYALHSSIVSMSPLFINSIYSIYKYPIPKRLSPGQSLLLRKLISRKFILDIFRLLTSQTTGM